MSETPRRRGRPKGTGINDSAALQAINSLLSTDRALKPTTAIRRSGITDPSVIRRLREKLKADHQAPRPITARPAPAAATSSLAPAASRPPSHPGSTAPARPQQAQSPQSTPNETPKTVAASPTPPPQPSAPPSATERPPQPEPHAPRPDSGPTAPPHSAQPPDPQLEAMRLAAEAAAAMSRLYLHCINNAAQTSPLSIALNGQAMVSQWFASVMSAQIAAQRKPKP